MYFKNLFSVTRFQYDHFTRMVKDQLILNGCEIEWENNRCWCFRHIEEKLYLPKWKHYKGYINILVTKGTEVIANYRGEHWKASTEARRFFAWNYKRNLTKLLENDSETNAYI